MKTITMDFETYQEELKQARIKGFDVTKGLHSKLTSLIEVLSCGLMDRDAFYKAKRDLANLLKELEEVSQ